MKKFLALIIAVVMTFSMVAMPVNAIDAADIEKFETTANEVFDYVEKLIESIHALVGGILGVLDKECPFCTEIHGAEVILPADPSTLADVLAVAKEGETVSLAAGDYGVITLGTLNGVTLAAEEGAVVDKFVTTAETAITDVTLKGFNFEIEAVNRDCGLSVDAAAVINNLVIEDCTFTGSDYKNSCGIFGNNPNATLTVKNCTFSDMGYAFWSISRDGYAALNVEGCNFTNLISWVILVQYGFLGNLTVDGCTFTNCTDGISKNGEFAADKTFTFTNNVVAADCAGHDGKDSKWFDLTTASAIVSGNTYGGAEWIPGAAQGIKAL